MTGDPPSPACPECGSENTRRSWPFNAWERLRGAAGNHAYRCEQCDHRFFTRQARTAGSKANVNDEERRRLPPPWLLVIFAIPLGLAIGWLLRAPGPIFQADTLPPAKVAGMMPQTPDKPIPKRAQAGASTTTARATTAGTQTTTSTSTTAKRVTAATAPPAKKKPPAPAKKKPAKVKQARTKPTPVKSQKKQTRPRTTKKAAAPAKVYTVQVGAYRTLTRARNYAKKLSAKGYRPQVVKVATPDNAVWYKVWVGWYSSRKQASSAAGRIKNSTGSAVMVTRRDQPGVEKK